MAPTGDDVGSRVEALLAQLRRQGGEPAADTGEELVRELVEFYGGGLERIAAIIAEKQPELALALIEDPLVASQLLLHGLHPLGIEERINAALEEVRPSLGANADGVRYLGIDQDGVAHLHLTGAGKSCATGAAKQTLFEAVLAAAPELTDVAVELDEVPKPLLQIGLRPGLEHAS